MFGSLVRLTMSSTTQEPLVHFKLVDYKTTITVTRIIDGDTIMADINLPLAALSKYTIHKKRGNKNVPVARVLGTHDDTTVLTLGGKCRFYGIDAYEKNTDAGKKATEILKEHIKEGDRVECVFHGKGKYGRHMISLFPEKIGDLNKYLIKNFPDNFREYYGGAR